MLDAMPRERVGAGAGAGNGAGPAGMLTFPTVNMMTHPEDDEEDIMLARPVTRDLMAELAQCEQEHEPDTPTARRRSYPPVRKASTSFGLGLPALIAPDTSSQTPMAAAPTSDALTSPSLYPRRKVPGLAVRKLA